MFSKILIANRGEIASRIMRTAREHGIKCVAIYSDIDAKALYLSEADEAYPIGGSTATESYLCSDKVIDVAIQAGCEAIHPGYGFLSENADFAQKCQDAGLVFIGPPASVIRDMGSKAKAKAALEQADIPVIPGYHGSKQDDKALLKQAQGIGFPILLKAAAGGGGKGMRVVYDEAEFSDSLAAAKREARASFDDDRIILEKFLATARHIEIQVFADNDGNVVHLFERDCSAQRRHQKIIEETPACNFPEALRQKMTDAACRVASTIGYIGAGTVEFLVENNDFYFMEMNTRLQVEHAVTEMVTGVDLVAWQLLIASGGSLPLTQDQIQQTGHALEVRIYAENPSNDFLPSVGQIEYLHSPKESAHVRLDTSVRPLDHVSQYYDPMIAKLVVYAKDRHSCIHKTLAELGQYHVHGVMTNIHFAKAVLQSKAFLGGEIHTQYIAKHHAEFIQPGKMQKLAYACACFIQFKQNQTGAVRAILDPWAKADGWRMNAAPQLIFEFTDKTEEMNTAKSSSTPLAKIIEGTLNNALLQLTFPDMSTIEISGTLKEQTLSCFIQHKHYFIHYYNSNNTITLFGLDQDYTLEWFQTEPTDLHHIAKSGMLTAPMPSTVVSIAVAEGDAVRSGDKLMVVEAMKMEHALVAPFDGIVDKIYLQSGAQASENAKLIHITPHEEA